MTSILKALKFVFENTIVVASLSHHRSGVVIVNSYMVKYKVGPYFVEERRFSNDDLLDYSLAPKENIFKQFIVNDAGKVLLLSKNALFLGRKSALTGLKDFSTMLGNIYEVGIYEGYSEDLVLAAIKKSLFLMGNCNYPQRFSKAPKVSLASLTEDTAFKGNKEILILRGANISDK